MCKIFTLKEILNISSNDRIKYTDSYLIKYDIEEEGYVIPKNITLYTNGKNKHKVIEKYVKKLIPNIKRINSIIYE